MDPSLACFGALPPGPVPVYSRGSSLTKTSSGPSLNVESPVSAAKVAAAHNAQMDAMMAAARADYDAKVAELMADLEGTRGEKERADTDLAFLKASSRKERLQWNKNRTLLNRKVAEAEARSHEAADGVASPEEFVALQEGLATREATIEDLQDKLAKKEAQQEKMRFEVACASTAEADVTHLMVRVATLEKSLAEERDAKNAAQEGAETCRAEVRGLGRRLAAAQEAAIWAEDDTATCIEDVARVATEVREARASQRHAELWLEKSLAEVDAVHAMLSYERSGCGMVGGGGGGGGSPAALQQRSTCAPPPPSPAFFGATDGGGGGGSVCGSSVDGGTRGSGAAVGPTSQNLQPEPLMKVLRPVGCGGGGDVVAAGGNNGANVEVVVGSPDGRSSTRGSSLRTPDLDGTGRPLPFSAPTAAGTRSRSRLEGREMGLPGDEMARTVGMSGAGEGRGRGFGRGARAGGLFSPPTPTVLFGEPDGGQEPAIDSAWQGKTLRSAGMQLDLDTSSKANDTGTPVEEGATSRLSQQLRLEVSRREEAEARIADLENASAATAASSAAAAQNKAAGRRGLAAASASEAPFVEGRADGNVETRPGTAPHSFGGDQRANFASASVGDDAWASFAVLDNERQREKIVGLVREARTKMIPSRTGKSVGSRKGGANGRTMGSAVSGSFPAVESSSWNESQINLASEVASLIEQLEEQVTKSASDNVQLRDFCTHLEGLLAAREARGSGAGSDPAAAGSVANRRRVFAAGYE